MFALQMLGATQSVVGAGAGWCGSAFAVASQVYLPHRVGVAAAQTPAPSHSARRRGRRRVRAGRRRALRAADVLAARPRAVAGAVVAARRRRGRRALRRDQRRIAGRDRRARPDAARQRARHAGARAGAVAADVVDAEVRRAVRVHARRAGAADRNLPAAHGRRRCCPRRSRPPRSCTTSCRRRCRTGTACTSWSSRAGRRPRRRTIAATTASIPCSSRRRTRCRPRSCGTRPRRCTCRRCRTTWTPCPCTGWPASAPFPRRPACTSRPCPSGCSPGRSPEQAVVAADALLAVARLALLRRSCTSVPFSCCVQTLPTQLNPVTQSALVAQLVLQFVVPHT